jgi:hypothetical protein
LRDEMHGVFRIHRPLVGDNGREVDTLDEAHVYEEPAFDLSEVVDGDDVWLDEPSCKRRLPAESGLILRIHGQCRRESFERNSALLDGVEGAVDLTHNTSADKFVEPVEPELLRHRHVPRLGWFTSRRSSSVSSTCQPSVARSPRSSNGIGGNPTNVSADHSRPWRDRSSNSPQWRTLRLEQRRAGTRRPSLTVLSS